MPSTPAALPTPSDLSPAANTALARPLSCCPACGQGLEAIAAVRWNVEAGLLTWPGGAVEFTPRQSLIFDVLWRAFEKGATLTGEQLLTRAYSDDINGGPVSSTIVVFLNQMRRRMAGSPLQIARNPGRRSKPYRLTIVRPCGPLMSIQRKGQL
jgi:hypothetical protein